MRWEVLLNVRSVILWIWLLARFNKVILRRESNNPSIRFSLLSRMDRYCSLTRPCNERKLNVNMVNQQEAFIWEAYVYARMATVLFLVTFNTTKGEVLKDSALVHVHVLKRTSALRVLEIMSPTFLLEARDHNFLSVPVIPSLIYSSFLSIHPKNIQSSNNYIINTQSFCLLHFWIGWIPGLLLVSPLNSNMASCYQDWIYQYQTNYII